MTCGFESIKVQSVATPKHAVQIEASEEGGQLGKVFFHAAKLRGMWSFYFTVLNLIIWGRNCDDLKTCHICVARGVQFHLYKVD